MTVDILISKMTAATQHACTISWLHATDIRARSTTHIACTSRLDVNVLQDPAA
jgi:hypothetical protein